MAGGTGSARGIRAGRAYVELGIDDKLAAGLKKASARLKAFGASVRTLGLKMMGVGTALAAPLAAGAKAFADFESQMAMVSTMLSNPDQFMGAFSKGVREMSVRFGESTETLSKGLYDILSASVPAEHALSFLETAAKAATGGMTDTAVAVDGLTSLMNAYGIEASRVGEVSDRMFATVKSGKITFEQLAHNIGKVAPMARAAGMDMDAMLASIATMTRQGLSAEQATTRLVAVLRKFPSAAGDIAALAEQFRGMALEDIMAQVPEVEAAGGLAALAADLPGLQRDLAAMADSSGEAEKAFAKMAGTLKVRFNQVKQAVLSAAVSVGEVLAPVLKVIAERVAQVVEWIRGWIAANPGLVRSIAAITAGLIVGGAAMVALGTAIGAVGRVLGVFAVVLPVIGKGLLLLASPVGLVIGAFIALGTIVLTTTKAGGDALAWLGGKFAGLVSDAKSAIGAIGNALAKGDLGLAMRVLWETLKFEWAKGKAKILTMANEFMFGLKAIWIQVSSGITGVWIDLTHGLKLVWIEFANWHKRTVEKLGGWFAKRWIEIQGVFDESIDVEVAKGFVDQQVEDRLDQIERGRIAALQANEADWTADEQANEKARQERLAALAQGNSAEEDRIRAEVDAARAAWEKALADANAPGPARAEGEDGPPGMGDVQTQIRDALAGVEGLLGQAGPGSQSRGTFLGAAVGALGSSVEQKQLSALEKIAEHTKAMVKQRQGLLFTR